MLKILYNKTFLAIVSAVLMALAFPKFNMSFLAWICLVPLLVAMEGEDYITSFRLGFIAGFIFYAITIYWLVETLRQYGELNWPLSLLIGALLMAYLAIYFGLFCGLTSFFNRYFYSFNIFLIASLWVALEYLRTYLLSGFPWNLLGYSQWNNLVVAQVSSFTGVYGVGFLIVLINALVAKIISYAWQLSNRKQSVQSIQVVVLIMSLSIGYGLVIMARDNVDSDHKPIKTAIIQANIPPDVKWLPESKKNIMRQYQFFVDRLNNDLQEVIVFPETAIPGLLREEPELLAATQKMAKSAKASLLVGALDRRGTKFYTSCFGVNAEGDIIGQYDKTHLVPFGEIFPYRKYLEKFIPIVRDMGDFTPGDKLNILKSPYSNYGVSICYEDIFPDLVRRLSKNGAEVLVNITIDSWYLNTSAPYQHFYMNVFRAIENRRWVIRSTASGLSGYIDPYGAIYAQTELFQPQVTVHMVTPMNKMTFYTKYGDLFAKTCSVLVILGYFGGLIRRKSNA